MASRLLYFILFDLFPDRFYAPFSFIEFLIIRIRLYQTECILKRETGECFITKGGVDKALQRVFCLNIAFSFYSGGSLSSKSKSGVVNIAKPNDN